MAKRTPTIYDNMEFPPYEFQPYPKMMFKGNATDSGAQQQKVVESASEERAAAADGWKTSDEFMAKPKG